MSHPACGVHLRKAHSTPGWTGSGVGTRLGVTGGRTGMDDGCMAEGNPVLFLSKRSCSQKAGCRAREAIAWGELGDMSSALATGGSKDRPHYVKPNQVRNQ